MIALRLNPSSTAPLSSRPSLLSSFKSVCYTCSSPTKKLSSLARPRNGTCRAALADDAPFAVAIGGCILFSLGFPVASLSADDDDDGDEGGSVIDSDDARFAVMGILGFIPYFNWLSWVFAWLDTGKRRYALFAFVYLAPYLRTNLSLSPDDSWLPIASIVLCIIHIQLEASIKNGDLQGFQLFSKAARHFPSFGENRFSFKDQETQHGASKQRTNHQNLTSAEEQSRNEIRGWEVPTKLPQDSERLEKDGEAKD